MAATNDRGRAAMETRAPDSNEQDPPPEDGQRQRSDDATRFVLVGGGHVGRALAERLAEESTVRHIDTRDPDQDEVPGDGGETGQTVYVPDITSLRDLAAQSIDEEDLVVVLGGDDGRTLLVTQLLRTKLGVDRVCAVIVDPRNADAFDIPGVRVVCTAGVLADAVGTAADSDLFDAVTDAEAG